MFTVQSGGCDIIPDSSPRSGVDLKCSMNTSTVGNSLPPPNSIPSSVNVTGKCFTESLYLKNY